ncbi:MAG: hypothetical protein ACJ79X_00400, partial [Gemmatimonadaceae bacterium]
MGEGRGYAEAASNFALRVVADLVADGYLEIERRGTSNHYRVHPEVRLRHPNLADVEVGVILAALTDVEPASRGGRSPARAPSRGAHLVASSRR